MNTRDRSRLIPRLAQLSIDLQHTTVFTFVVSAPNSLLVDDRSYCMSMVLCVYSALKCMVLYDTTAVGYCYTSRILRDEVMPAHGVDEATINTVELNDIGTMMQSRSKHNP